MTIHIQKTGVTELDNILAELNNAYLDKLDLTTILNIGLSVMMNALIELLKCGQYQIASEAKTDLVKALDELLKMYDPYIKRTIN